mmetsp:Transcript_29043/g.45128  ORF Transcript_29043/g.45128 Transcript_29043/m.45128 type:complete len:84 (-) Transcript_29043:329-580(-)|eukprot:CAMPEP_0196809302 /NCGR_PEP_ID=MMETSP1362-20130617/9254_1 /TAXON_ID=163516 /ORGANISM="Leptocylindrus danicus, Strain CCMP1856" /LENGTH=83 /DNA_ID=CAMNT_0042183949 /DNA_START=260 /DNA_END=511 /DNA_ORIENTATION=+
MSTTDAKKTSTAEEKAPQTPPDIVEALEEDDEFEEFAPAGWDDLKDTGAADEAAQWQDNWDDDDIDDDFTKSLRAELMKNSGS